MTLWSVNHLRAPCDRVTELLVCRSHVAVALCAHQDVGGENEHVVDLLAVEGETGGGSLVRRFFFQSASRPVLASSDGIFVLGRRGHDDDDDDDDDLLHLTCYDPVRRRTTDGFSVAVAAGFQRASIVGGRVLLLQVCWD